MHAMIVRVIFILVLIMELLLTFCAQRPQIAQALILTEVSHMRVPVTTTRKFSTIIVINRTRVSQARGGGGEDASRTD